MISDCISSFSFVVRLAFGFGLPTRIERKQIAWLAIECAAQFFEHVGTEHLGLAVAEAHQSRVRDAAFLAQAVQRPALAFQ